MITCVSLCAYSCGGCVISHKQNPKISKNIIFSKIYKKKKYKTVSPNNKCKTITEPLHTIFDDQKYIKDHTIYLCTKNTIFGEN